MVFILYFVLYCVLCCFGIINDDDSIHSRCKLVEKSLNQLTSFEHFSDFGKYTITVFSKDTDIFKHYLLGPLIAQTPGSVC